MLIYKQDDFISLKKCLCLIIATFYIRSLKIELDKGKCFALAIPVAADSL